MCVCVCMCVCVTECMYVYAHKHFLREIEGNRLNMIVKEVGGKRQGKCSRGGVGEKERE